jgi:hypothetical protein
LWIQVCRVARPPSGPLAPACPAGGALAVGGDVGGSASSASELFDAASNQWASAGEVLVAGGAEGTLSWTSRDIPREPGSELYSATGRPVSASVSRPVPPPGSPWLWVGLGGLVVILAAVAAIFRRRLPGLHRDA